MSTARTNGTQGSSTLPWRHVLVTTDLSAAAEHALEPAAGLARSAGGRITVLNVIDLAGLGDSWALRESLVRLERGFRLEVRPRLEKTCEQTFAGLAVKIDFIEGMGAAPTICRYADEHDVDLILIATHGHTGARRFVVGSVAERVVQHAPCDVMVVRSDREAKAGGFMEIANILVPTDFSKSADRALERAIELAHPTGAEIHLLHAYEFPSSVGVLDVTLGVRLQFSELIREAAQKQLDQRVKHALRGGRSAHALLSAERPGQAILDGAAKVGADLIVMGTQGRTGMKHVLLGSVAERTVRLASCPVLAVKAAAES